MKSVSYQISDSLYRKFGKIFDAPDYINYKIWSDALSIDEHINNTYGPIIRISLEEMREKYLV